MSTACETIKEDVLTVYKSSGRRLQQIRVPTKTSQTIIDLPSTFIKSSVVVMFEDLRIVPHDIKSSQLIMNMPSGLVVVEGKDGMEHEGTLESLSGTEAIIRERETSALIHIPNFKSINFEKRFVSRKVTLSYLLGGLSWQAKHTLLIDPNTSRVVVFKTMALVHNNTGVIFNLTSLKLGIGDPAPMSSAYGANFAEEYEEEHLESKRASPRRMMKMSASAHPASLMAMAPSASAIASAPMPTEVYESNTVENDGVEDYEFIDIGPQTLGDHGRFDILSLADIPIRKIYFYEIRNTSLGSNTSIDFGYKMVIPKDTHIPSGEIVIYSFDKENNKFGTYLGKSNIKEQFQQDEMDIKLGTTNLVRVQTTVNEVEEDKFHDEDVDIDLEDADFETTNFDSHQLQSLLNLERKARSARGGGSLPPKIKLSDINVLLKKDVPKIKHTTIESTFTNNSAKSPAYVIASFPVPYREKILDMTCKYSRIKNGMMEFNLVIPPSKTLPFHCEITTQLSQ